MGEIVDVGSCAVQVARLEKSAWSCIDNQGFSYCVGTGGPLHVRTGPDLQSRRAGHGDPSLQDWCGPQGQDSGSEGCATRWLKCTESAHQMPRSVADR